MENKFTITDTENKQRLDKVLTEKFPIITRSQWQKRIKQGEVLLNQKITTVHHFVKLGDVINIIPTAGKIKSSPAVVKAKLDNIPTTLVPNIISDQPDYLVLDKPAGLLVHPTHKKENDTLVAWLAANYPKINTAKLTEFPGLVHRLDQEVSGLLVIAKTATTAKLLQEQFQTRKIKKIYTALVYGVLTTDQGQINLPIGRAATGQKMAAHTQSHLTDKEALTEYEVIKRYVNQTLLAVTIHTGRTHQIRVHLKAFGYPIVGDKLYGPAGAYFHDGKKKIKVKTDLTRPFLHSTTLGFFDPAGIWQEFNSPLPADLQNYLAKLPAWPRKAPPFSAGPYGVDYFWQIVYNVKVIYKDI